MRWRQVGEGVGGAPPLHQGGLARDDLPAVDHYPGGQTTPTPEAVDFTPGHLLGSAIYGPNGRPLAEAGNRETGIAIADLDDEILAATRQQLTMLQDAGENVRS